MSISRQRTEPHVRAVAIGFSSGFRWHSGPSEWGQLVRATPGMIRVQMGDAHLVIPPHQALWIPAACAHDVVMSGRGTLIRVYVRAWPGAATRLPRHVGVVSVSPLLREVVRRAVRLGTLHRGVPAERRLMEVLLDECESEPASPLQLPLPRDPRARRAAEFVRDGAGRGTRVSLAAIAHASPRTLERIFLRETGLSLGTWTRRARLMRAIAMLADGTAVSATAAAAGYASTSAFVAAFRRALGTTPSRYFQRHNDRLRRNA